MRVTVASDFGSEGGVIIYYHRRSYIIFNPLSRHIMTSYCLRGAFSTLQLIILWRCLPVIIRGTHIIIILCIYLALFTLTLPRYNNSCTVDGAISFARFHLTRIIMCAI